MHEITWIPIWTNGAVRHVPPKYLRLLIMFPTSALLVHLSLDCVPFPGTSRAMPPSHPHPSGLDLVRFVSLLIMGGLTQCSPPM